MKQVFNSIPIRSRKEILNYLKIKSILDKNVICFLDNKNVICFLDNKNRLFSYKVINNILPIKQKIFLSAVKIGSDNILLYLNSKNNKTIILKEIEKLGELLH